jgi:hypothetical protein
MALRKTTLGLTYFATVASLVVYVVLRMNTGTAYAFSPWWAYGALIATFIFQVLSTLQYFKQREGVVIPAVIVSIILTILLGINYNFGTLFF